MDKWLRNTNVVRIIALAVGILLWVVVHLEDRSIPGGSGAALTEYTISNVAVTPRYDSNQFFVQSIEPPQVVVTLSGKESALKKVSTSGYSVELDLTKVGKGEHVLPLTPVNFPPSVIVKIYPASVKVVLEEKVKKEVPVTINVTGTPATGLKAGQPIIKPNRVIVTMPSSRVDDTDSVRADVSVDKAQTAVSKQVRLVAYDKNGKVIEGAAIDPPVVDVEVPITSPFTTVPLQLKLAGETARGFSVASITKSTDKVTAYGPQEVVDKMEFYEGPAINLQDLKETKDLTLDIPLKNKITQVEPSKVDVRIEVVPSVYKTLEGISFSIVGQNDLYDTKVLVPETGKLNVTVEGAPAVLDKLKPEDIQAIVDISNLPPGQHELPVTLNLPTFVKKGPQQDFKVTVEISAKQTKVARP
ncbi:YbbR-like domain-containing protein [Paenibacillus hamazuiensis]|uniref:CdaR family protein n=1 Tax=Paenibacillus hamazuiensis TaxID=2936508 RepID=UPI00200D6EBD|nr:CdaR family protein [Paenibacillus hamazuiensis]